MAKTISFISLITLVALSLLGAAILPSVAGASVGTWSQGFEVDVDGWFTPTRVPSGTDGISSSEGAFHAQAVGNEFTRWGGYESTFPTYGYVTEVDVYLDMSEADGSDKRVDFSSAISRSDGSHLRDFIFHLGTNPGVPGQWAASVSNNAPGWPLNPGRSPIDITDSGWYTLRSTFEANASNTLEVTMDIIDENDVVIGSWVLSTPSDVIGSVVGGNRYGWFVNVGVDTLAFDNTIKYDIVNNPAEKSECKDGGWEDFGFENQGQCVRFVETEKDSR